MNGKLSKSNIQNEIINCFSEIRRSLGLNKSKIRHDSNISSIYFMGKNALEIEVDWHENALWVYVVRLIGEKLPNDDIIYYYDDGSWCRKYIDDIYQKKNPIYQSSDRKVSDFILKLVHYYKNLIEESPDILSPYFE